MIDRRALMTLAAASALAGCQTVTAAPATPIGAIRVDVSRLVALGVGPRAATIKARLEQELAGLVSPGRPRGGATLAIEARGFTMSSYAGSDADDGSGQDHFDSVSRLIGPGGEVLATYPILSSNGSGDAGAWYDPQLPDKRVDLLVKNHALWIRRAVGG